MKIKVNGQAVEIPDHLSVADLLTHQKVKMPDMVTVQRNAEILDRKNFAATKLAEHDEIEFLYFMGGGAGVAGRSR